MEFSPCNVYGTERSSVKTEAVGPTRRCHALATGYTFSSARRRPGNVYELNEITKFVRINDR